MSKKKEEDSKKGKKTKKTPKPEGYDCCVVSSISPSSGSTGEKGKKGKKGKKDKRGKCIVPDYSLSIEKAQRQDNPVAPGSTVNYDLTISNGGTTTAPKGFVVSDPIPTWLTYVSASGSGFSCTHVVLYDEVRCTATADLAKNTSRVITVTVTVDADAGNADPVVNTACLEDSSDAKVLASGCSSVTTEFPEGGLTLTKTNNPVEAIQLDGFGSTVTYTLTASATGALDQTNVVVTDILPGYDPAHSSSARVNLADGVNSIVCKDSSSAVISPCGSYGSASHKVTAALGTITSGTSKTVEITVVVPIQTTATPPTTLEILNQGHAKSDLLGDDEDVDSETVRNVVAISGDNGTTRAVCDVDTPEFDIAGAGFQEGDVVTMDIYDSNNTLVYTDYQPSNELAPVQQTADANGKVQFSGVWWPGFSNSPSKIYPDPLLLQIKVVLHAAGSVPTSLGDGGFNVSLVPTGSGHSTDPVTIDYPTASKACTPIALDIVKSNNPTVSTTITEFGAEITYTMDVTASEDNLVDARLVTVSDVLPGYDTVTSGKATYKAGSAACDANIAALGSDSTCDITLSNSNHTVTWELGVLRPGDARQVSFVVTVDLQGTSTNPASFTLKNQASLDSADTDPQGSNVVENPVVVPLRAEISVVKKASISEANPNNTFYKTVARARGKIVTYRYVVSNTGTLPVSNIKLVDDLNFGPRYGSAVQSTPNESNLFNCRVGDAVGAAPSYGETQSFNLGQAIGNSSVLTLQPGRDMYLYCDLRVPTSLTDDQIARNDLYDKASVSGRSATGTVRAVSNVVVVDLVKVDSDLVVFKNITDEDGNNYRKYEQLGRLEVPTLKTYRMFVDNVSTSPQRVQVYDYFSNVSRGLSKAQRDAIFRSMTCINYNANNSFTGPFPNPVPVVPAPDGAFLSPAQEVTFGEATGGGGAGTFLARYQDIGTLLPEEGWNFVCQALLPPGEYDLTNIFRVVSTPILAPTALSGSGVVRTNAVPAVTGKQDISTSAGVETTTPFDEGGGSGGGVSDESGSPLAKTGADLVIPTAILGMLLVGLGIGARRLGRATR